MSSHITTILKSPDEVPNPPSASPLRFSGFSVLVYGMVRFSSTSSAVDRLDRNLPQLAESNSYATKLRTDSPLRYSTMRSVQAPARMALQPTSGPLAAINYSLVWIDREYVLVVFPMLFSVERTPAYSGGQLRAEAGLEDLMDVVRWATTEEQLGQLVGAVVADLVSARLITDEDVERTWALPGLVGLQLWDLEGTLGRPPSLYRGKEESQRYCWEIAALMSHSADHVLDDGLWQRQSKEQVFSSVREGFSFLDDHMAFVNSSCCLEISHLPVGIRQRSQFRMESYGYDSSSLFVWSIGCLRGAIVDDLSVRYRSHMAALVQRDGMTAHEQTDIAQRQLVHYWVIDTCAAFGGMLREPRNRELDLRISESRSFLRAVVTLGRDMDKAAKLTEDLVRARDQTLQGRTNVLLASLGVAVAAVGVPGMVEQLSAWIDHHAWTNITVSALALMLVVIVLLGGVRRNR